MARKTTQQKPTLNAKWPAPARLAQEGYVAFLRAGAPSNAWRSNAGFGRTPTEAIRASCYWANQLPWVTVVRAVRAPKWAREEAQESATEAEALAELHAQQAAEYRAKFDVERERDAAIGAAQAAKRES